MKHRAKRHFPPIRWEGFTREDGIRIQEYMVGEMGIPRWIVVNQRGKTLLGPKGGVRHWSNPAAAMRRLRTLMPLGRACRVEWSR